MKAVWGVITGLLFSLTASAEVEVISQSELQAWQQAGKEFLLLDVRTPGEYAKGHIQDAVNVEFNRIEEAMAQLADWKDKPVVVYCRSGRRAGIAEAYLDKQGFSGLRHLEGDIQGWRKADLPLVK